MSIEISILAAAVGSLGALLSAFKSLELFRQSKEDQEKAKVLADEAAESWKPENPKLSSPETDAILSKRRVTKLTRPPEPEHDSRKLVLACGIVALVFGLSVSVIWCLTRIGPIAAEVEASIKKLGGSVWIAGGGLFGCFFAIALLGFGAIYVFGRTSK
jgi:hypothetical protein